MDVAEPFASALEAPPDGLVGEAALDRIEKEPSRGPTIGGKGSAMRHARRPVRMVRPVGLNDDETITADRTFSDRPHVAALVPQQLFAGRYEVRSLLGRGGMGAVYRVLDRKLDEEVALKLLTLSTERAVERFLREVRLARRVTHPNVARTHDLGEHDGVHFLTMEYVRGRALDRVLDEEQKLAPERAARIAVEIAAGLEAAHTAGVVHRDLKPANVLIGDDGRVVLTDFGIARATQLETRTRETGTVLGTPDYMAPEQMMGQRTDARCDIYALGLILFEMLTGRLPWEADTPLATVMMRMHRPPLDPRTLGPVPDALAELILRCLERDRERRPGSAAEVAALLSPFVHRSGATSPRQSTPSNAWFAPMSPGGRAVAVLPFVYRGAAEHDYLGEGMAEELIDVLSRTQGLRVLALGATRRFADARDPAVIGAELGADAVVDGTVQLAGSRVRISARLLDTDTGLQRWSARFDGSFEDVFALQERMGRRVAESLRVEIGAAAHRHTAPQEAIELYLRARKELRQNVVQPTETLAMLERCLELAPGLLPAYPAHAIAAVRAWWRDEPAPDRSRGQLARESVARASRLAPDLAETHLVQAMLAVQEGHYRQGSQALARALEIAPTMADAHQYLADLQVEGGRPHEGKRRAQLAHELDPSLTAPHVTLARIAALDGDFDSALERLLRAEKMLPSTTIALVVSRMRYGLWSGDHDAARRAGQELLHFGTDASRRLALAASVGVGDVPIERLAPMLDRVPQWADNQRYASLMYQIATETFCSAGAHDLALESVRRASEGVLVDLEWMRRCPLLAPLRTNPIYIEAFARVEQRADAIWKR